MQRTLNIAARYNKARRAILAVGVLALAFSPPAAAEERQYKIEAAYLYNFFNYITWPGYDSPQKLHTPVICVFGNDPIISYLDYVRSKAENERLISIRSVSDETTTTGCNILFIRHHISPRLLGKLANDTLLVLKPDDPLDRGGMIELTEDEDRIAIKIDQSHLEQNGFQVSSRLLDLAQKVR